MKHLYLILFLVFNYNFIYSQANAGLDKTVSATHTKTKIGTPTDPTWCYHWEANPADPSLTNISSPIIEVSPAKTTIYKLTVTGPDFSFISKDEVTVFKFGIEYLRHSAGKEWKVVVGEPIEFSAIASLDCKNWVWDMEDGLPDTWNPTGGNTQKGNTMTIPYSDLSSVANKLRGNNIFGDAYGTVTVTCEDAEGNIHKFSSADLNPSEKVKVFFDPDKNVDGGTSNTANPPCWFVFWKDGKVVEDINICSYDDDPTQKDYEPLYGYWSASTGMVLGKLAPTNNGPTETLKDLNGTPFTMTGTGKHLDCIAETIAHELHHRDIYKNWGGPGPIRKDHSDTDGLPDKEEDTPSEAFFPVSDPTNPDSFKYNYDPKKRVYDYSDNEVRCRIIELHKSKKTFPEKDWSKSIDNPKW